MNRRTYKVYKKTEDYAANTLLLLLGFGGLMIPSLNDFVTGILLGYVLGYFLPMLLKPLWEYWDS